MLIQYSNKSHTFPFENRKNIAAIALSPDSNVLISVDEGMSVCMVWGGYAQSIADGRALLVNVRRGIVLHHHNFKKAVNAIQFSPDGKCDHPALPYLGMLVINICITQVYCGDTRFSHSSMENSKPPHT